MDIRSQPRLLTAVLPDADIWQREGDILQVRMQDNVRCGCGARVRCFPRSLDLGFAMLCDDGHDFIVLEPCP
jgi:hypothetical protein